MRSLAIVLLIANLWLWFGREPQRFEDRTTYEDKIAALEKALPDLRAAASWSARIEPILGEAESELSLSALTQRLQNTGVTLTESGGRPGQADFFEWAGNGDEAAVARFLGQIERESALVVKRLSLSRRDDDLIEFRSEVGIKPALAAIPLIPGCGTIGRPETFPEPVMQTQPQCPTGRRGLFGRVSKPMTSAPVRIKYLGYYAGQATPSVILEENGGVTVLRVGEKTPTGLLLKAADERVVRLVNGRKETMRIEMEKKR